MRKYIVLLTVILSLSLTGQGAPQTNRGGKHSSAPSAAGFWVNSFWVKSNVGIEEEGISAIVILPDGALFAAVAPTAHDTSTQTLFRSQDGGSTWLDLTQKLPLQKNYGNLPPVFRTQIEAGARTVQFIFAHDKSLFVSLEDLDSDSGGQRLLRSEDKGSTWTEVEKGFLAGLYIKDLEVAPDGSMVMLAEDLTPDAPSAPVSHFFRSINGGVSWKRFHSYVHNIADMVITSSGSIVCYSPTAGIYLSTSGGQSWFAERDNVAPLRVTSYRGVLQSHPDGSLYLVSPKGGLRHSQDQGRTWSDIESGSAPRLASLYITRNGDLYGRTSSDQLYRSSNFGASWLELGSGLPYNLIMTIFERPDGQLYVGARSLQGHGYGHGVYRSRIKIAQPARAEGQRDKARRISCSGEQKSLGRSAICPCLSEFYACLEKLPGNAPEAVANFCAGSIGDLYELNEEALRELATDENIEQWAAMETEFFESQGGPTASCGKLFSLQGRIDLMKAARGGQPCLALDDWCQK